MTDADSQSRRFTLPRQMRLSGRSQFARVYNHRTRTSAGPLLVYAAPNDHGLLRLGLSVPRRIGKAVLRNTIKRRLREAFRLLQHDWPAMPRGYDLVISVRPHEPLRTQQYRDALSRAIESLHKTWSRKLDKQKQ